MIQKKETTAVQQWHPQSSCRQVKPIELYVFVDPLCADCWGLEPIVKKLLIEYGHYFSMRYILSATIDRLNYKNYHAIAHHWEQSGARSGMSCDGTLWLENPIAAPHIISMAIKAAELQGKRYGFKILRELQERVFLGCQNIADVDTLLASAHAVGLDVCEFEKDIHSSCASKAFQCDLRIMQEMEVDEIPTFVFFNEQFEEEGIKVSGRYSYDIYEQIITEILGFTPAKHTPPALETFLAHFRFVATTEVAQVYDWSIQEAERELKKLQLQQKVEYVPAKHGSFWRYV